jgi:predicted aldo/keto reductase-like oxidoreductase
VNYRKLGKTGLMVSEVGFGGIPVQRVDFGEAEKIIRRCLEHGINFFDTARGYTDSEEKLGQALAGNRDKVILASKSMARPADAIIEDVEKSLKKLRTSYIDLYQVHNINSGEQIREITSPGGALAGLKKMQEQQKIRFIGITGHIPSLLVEVIKKVDLDTVQFPLNAVEQQSLEELLPLAVKKEIGTIIMKPLAGGALTRCSAALKYLLRFPVSTVIPGMQSINEVDENTGAAGSFLDRSEEDALMQEAKTLGSRFCRRCQYCLPCPQGINIPFNFLFQGYYQRYGLKQWATDRYNEQKVLASACTECGECEAKCPYNLPVMEMLKECAALMEK